MNTEIQTRALTRIRRWEMKLYAAALVELRNLAGRANSSDSPELKNKALKRVEELADLLHNTPTMAVQNWQDVDGLGRLAGYAEEYVTSYSDDRAFLAPPASYGEILRKIANDVRLIQDIQEGHLHAAMARQPEFAAPSAQRVPESDDAHH